MKSCYFKVDYVISNLPPVSEATSISLGLSLSTARLQLQKQTCCSKHAPSSERQLYQLYLSHCGDRIQGNTMREKKNRYLSMYSAKIDLINMELKHSTRAFERSSFWNHNGKCDSDRGCMREKFCRDDIHFSAAGQYQLYKSLRGALTSMASTLSQRQGAQAASTLGHTRSQ